MTIAKRINLLIVAGVVTAGAVATAVSVQSLRSAGEREAVRVRDQLMVAKQEKLRDLVRNTHRAVEEIYQNAQDPERVADTYRPLLKGAVDVAFSAIETVYADATLGEEEKQARAMAVVKGLRYGPEGKDYFWINDTGPAMVMHPYKPQLDGKDLSGFEDPNGKRLFVEFARVCQEAGEGFVDYLWPKYGSDQPVPKLSYVRLFRPWGWIVGSGVYLEVAQAKAQEDAKKLVASFRYGPEGKDYFWINDSRPHMVMHPYKPALDGTDLSGFKDPNGKFLFVEFARVCQEAGEGFVDYLWPKYGQDDPVAKLSFVKRFEPWDWIIGTGVYVDDVDAAVAAKRAAIGAAVNHQVWVQLASGGGITVLLALVAALFTSRAFRPLHGVIDALRDIAEGEGDLTKRLPLPYADCARERNCGHEECASYGQREACWSKVGSMQIVPDLVQCPGVLSGKVEDCSQCPVFQRVETDEFSVLSNWFNVFADKIRYTITVVKETMDVSAAMAQELSSSTGQIAASNRQVSDQTHTVASAAEEMTATVTEVATLTAMVSSAADESRSAASEGAEVIQQVVVALHEIDAEVGRAGETVRALGQQSNEIGEIVGIIEDIADQTNLLALNAAIEAARAGDAGRGFAVVADEVRKLAEKTVKATQEISSTVTTIRSGAEAAVNAMDRGTGVVEQGRSLGNQAGDAMVGIQDRVGSAADQVGQIASATEQLRATVTDIAQNMDHIAREISQNSDATESVAGNARLLAEKSERVKALSGRFCT